MQDQFQAQSTLRTAFHQEREDDKNMSSIHTTMLGDRGRGRLELELLWSSTSGTRTELASDLLLTWTPLLSSYPSIPCAKHGRMHGCHVLIILCFLMKSHPRRRLCLKLILHNSKENGITKTKGTEIIVRRNMTMFPSF